MYKNFKLTEEERSQILEMHMSHGYKKPLVEQEEVVDKDNMKTALKDIKIEGVLDEDRYEVSYYAHDTKKDKSCILTFSKIPQNSWAYYIDYESEDHPNSGGTWDEFEYGVHKSEKSSDIPGFEGTMDDLDDLKIR